MKTTNPPAPTNLQRTAADKPGMLDAHWDPAHMTGKKTYIVQMRVSGKTPSAEYQQVAIVTRSKARLVGLVSGELYDVRVATTHDGVESGWSNGATKIAP